MKNNDLFTKLRTVIDSAVMVFDVLIIGISLIPSITILSIFLPYNKLSFWVFLKFGILLSFSYLLFGLSLIVITFFLKIAFNIRSVNGSIPIISYQMAVFSFYHNLIHLCDVFFLKFLRSTSLINWYFKLMGARIGEGTIINTTRISDCDIITIGKNCVIGGDVVINGHSAESGLLYRERVLIGDNVTIGQYSTILPGVIIGDNVIVGANTVVPKGKVLEDNAVYIGNRIQLLDVKERIQPVPQITNSVTHFKDIDNVDLLARSYALRHAEILSIEKFISRITVSTLGLIISLIMYSILNNSPKLIALLPTLVGFSFAIVINLCFGMLNLGAYMRRIEILFNKLNVIDFDWENKYGIFGIARFLDLDNLFIDIIYFGIFVGGCYLILTDALFDDKTVFLSISLKTALIVIDSFIVFWIIFSASLFWYKRNRFIKELKDYDYKLNKSFGNIA